MLFKVSNIYTEIFEGGTGPPFKFNPVTIDQFSQSVIYLHVYVMGQSLIYCIINKHFKKFCCSDLSFVWKAVSYICCIR